MTKIAPLRNGRSALIQRALCKGSLSFECVRARFACDARLIPPSLFRQASPVFDQNLLFYLPAIRHASPQSVRYGWSGVRGDAWRALQNQSRLLQAHVPICQGFHLAHGTSRICSSAASKRCAMPSPAGPAPSRALRPRINAVHVFPSCSRPLLCDVAPVWPLLVPGTVRQRVLTQRTFIALPAHRVTVVLTMLRFWVVLTHTVSQGAQNFGERLEHLST